MLEVASPPASPEELRTFSPFLQQSTSAKTTISRRNGNGTQKREHEKASSRKKIKQGGEKKTPSDRTEITPPKARANATSMHQMPRDKQ
ncbi:hypothetical protein BC567DRAFT_235715 [Phyllosticta citribraziliensis]